MSPETAWDTDHPAFVAVAPPEPTRGLQISIRGVGRRSFVRRGRGMRCTGRAVPATACGRGQGTGVNFSMNARRADRGAGGPFSALRWKRPLCLGRRAIAADHGVTAEAPPGRGGELRATHKQKPRKDTGAELAGGTEPLRLLRSMARLSYLAAVFRRVNSVGRARHLNFSGPAFMDTQAWAGCAGASKHPGSQGHAPGPPLGLCPASCCCRSTTSRSEPTGCDSPF